MELFRKILLIAQINNIIANNTYNCIAAKNKKQEFYGGLLAVNNLECKNYEMEYDVDVNSKIDVKKFIGQRKKVEMSFRIEDKYLINQIDYIKVKKLLQKK